MTKKEHEYLIVGDGALVQCNNTPKDWTGPNFRTSSLNPKQTCPSCGKEFILVEED